MIRPILILPTLLATASAAQATKHDAIAPPALPTTAEVAAYVGTHWSDWGPRFANLAGHADVHAALLKVENVDCAYRYITPECSFDIVGDFGANGQQAARMFAQFDRDSQGHIEEVYVQYETRRK